MSSSTSPTTSSALGLCVVCGRESTKGCSKCKAAGLDWMYFCSVDHQRLIWKTHKLVCGKNPFTYPPLSEQEAEEMWELRRDRSHRSAPLLQTFQDIYQPPPGGIGWTEVNDDLLESRFQLQLAQLRDENSGTGVKALQALIHLFRGIAFGTKLEKSRDAKGDVTRKKVWSLLELDPLGFVSMVEQTVPPEVVLSDWWLRKFRHRIFIFIGTLPTEEETGVHGNRNVTWTISQIEKFARDTVYQIDPELARFLDHNFVPYLKGIVGVKTEGAALA